ncbi:mechanosensitive ion channel family protein [Pseudomonas oryzihabitans]|uniref:mechanosensitive ion channel family protein n=1 Tax=Pseudomonas oryzihabitans TaxID=47885 RepID=UPI00241DAB04|nr:mechanosensitive ion channel family protein [Pseudomonas oryzihabitans]
MIFRLLQLLCLCFLLIGPVQAALPGLPGAQKDQVDPQFGQSLDQVIKTLESDQQRNRLLADLKKLQAAQNKAEPSASQGVIGLITDTLTVVEQQLQRDNLRERWQYQLDQAGAELAALAPAPEQRLNLLSGFVVTLAFWAGCALGLKTISHRLRVRFGLSEELPLRPRTLDLVRFALRKLAPWLLAFILTLVVSLWLPDSLGKTVAVALAYAAVTGPLFAATVVVICSLPSGAHRSRALLILRRRAFRPLWIIGSLAALGGAASDPHLAETLGPHLAAVIAIGANICAALLTAQFALRFRRPIAHLIRNQPLAKRQALHGLQGVRHLIARLWHLPLLILVAVSVVATFVSAGDTSDALRRALLFAVTMGAALGLNALVRARLLRRRPHGRIQEAYAERLRAFFVLVLGIVIWLVGIELALRAWNLSLLRFSQGDGHAVASKFFGLGGTLLLAWLVWILADTAIHRGLNLHRVSPNNARAQTMLPLIRNVLFLTIFVIALIVALANMGVNVTPLLAGAGVIGLAVGFGAQSLVADLITGLFIIIEDSLAIGDYVDVGNHLGTVEGLTIRTVRLRDIDGIVHTIPFSEIKSIQNYSRQFGYAIFRLPIPQALSVDKAIEMVQEVGRSLRQDPLMGRDIWSPLELQGVESFDSGMAILRFRFKTAPIKQWEVSRAFNLRLKRYLDDAGIELASPRMNVRYEVGGSPLDQTTRGGQAPSEG